MKGRVFTAKAERQTEGQEEFLIAENAEKDLIFAKTSGILALFA